MKTSVKSLKSSSSVKWSYKVLNVRINLELVPITVGCHITDDHKSVKEEIMHLIKYLDMEMTGDKIRVGQEKSSLRAH